VAGCVAGWLVASGVLYAAAAIWTGADLLPNNNWTDANNWSRAHAPLAGDSLTFPAGAARLTNHNNFTVGTAFQVLTFSGPGYDISGNAIGLGDGILVSHGAGSTRFLPSFTLLNDQTCAVVQAAAELDLDGVMNLNGHTVTVDGAGTLVVSKTAAGDGTVLKRGEGVLRFAGLAAHTGFTRVESGRLEVDGTLGASFAMVGPGATLTGSGLVNGFSVTGGTVGPGDGGGGILRSQRGVSFGTNSTFQVVLDAGLLRLTSGQLSVTGSVQLAGCTLEAGLGPRFSAQIGDTFTIIKNDGTEAIHGTFLGLPEGAHLTIGGQPFLISYTGGTGNDVVLTYGKPRWTFTIMAGVSQRTADYYGGPGPVGLLISNQITTVNQRFNEPDVFEGYFNFVVTSVSVFSGDPVAEISVAHPNQDFKVVYDGYPTQGGGWYGNHLTIHHSWAVTNSGGPFGSTATDGIVHEFGHSRGAIDMYGLNVSAGGNPINGQSFTATRSIMTYPYGERWWDEYTQHLINENTSVVSPPISYITGAFPSSIRVRVVDPDGGGFPDVQVKLYPVPWFSTTVSNGAWQSGVTDANGEFQLPSNPYGPNTTGAPWNLRYPNFLVEARYLTATQYVWMPVYDVQNAYFDGPPISFPPLGRGFVLTLRMNVGTYDSWRSSHFSAAERADDRISGPLADPDGDSIKNLMEYALGLDPHTPNAPHLLTATRESSFVVASYTRRKLARMADVRFVHQMAKSLAGPWTTAPFVSVLDQGAQEVVGFREALPIDQSAGNFYRLEVMPVP